MAPARALGPHASQPIEGTWEVAGLPADAAVDPLSLEAQHARWIRCDGAMPVAAALIAAGELTLEHPTDLDSQDWWYRCRFSATPGSPQRLVLGGLATVADVWMNGEHVLHSENMYLEHAVPLRHVRRSDNELIMRFRALAPLLAVKRPRPRWRTQLISHQALRWYRTSLLGRMPGWCPAIAPVGPWRPIVLESAQMTAERAEVHARVAGNDGVVDLCLEVRSAAADEITGSISLGDVDEPLTSEQQPDGSCRLMATVHIARPRRWWPHTHGSPFLYEVRASLRAGDVAETLDLGRIGFRALAVDPGNDGRGFGLVVNEVPLFCRGVCWTPLDVSRLIAEAAVYRSALETLRDAGMNMVRIPGTMTYESEAFHDLCDELGILVWQDLMFANMDYPWSDATFARDAALEVRQVLQRLQSRPSLAIVCGNSEVEQQAAMLGLDADRRSNQAADQQLAGLAGEIVPEAIWLAGTPSGGAFPFQVDTGVCHYYGVGAYRRPFDDARRAGVRFAAECLAFSNVPDPQTAALVVPDASACGHDPRWKAGVPRDRGAAWDFEEVRDEYLERLFGVSPSELRSRNPERYLALGRVATGEAMLRTFAEWRRPGSTCRGGLVWFARDLAPGAGWGVIDATGRPKAAYWYLKRVFAPRAVVFADEGLNGLWLHVLNDAEEAIAAGLHLTAYRDGVRYGRSSALAIEVPPRGYQSFHADALFDEFRDLTYAYRFGPPAHDLIAAALRDRTTGALLADACYFPRTLPTEEREIGLTARVEADGDRFALRLQTDRFAFAVSIDFPDFSPDDNYVNVEPGSGRSIGLTAHRRGATIRGTVSALNGRSATTVAEPAYVR